MNAKQAKARMKKNIVLNPKVMQAITEAADVGMSSVIFYNEEISDQDISALKILGYDVSISTYRLRYRLSVHVQVSW